MSSVFCKGAVVISYSPISTHTPSIWSTKKQVSQCWGTSDYHFPLRSCLPSSPFFDFLRYSSDLQAMYKTDVLLSILSKQFLSNQARPRDQVVPSILGRNTTLQWHGKWECAGSTDQMEKIHGGASRNLRFIFLEESLMCWDWRLDCCLNSCSSKLSLGAMGWVEVLKIGFE